MFNLPVQMTCCMHFRFDFRIAFSYLKIRKTINNIKNVSTWLILIVFKVFMPEIKLVERLLLKR